MAQLRDRVTSALIAEGTPTDLLVVARQLGTNEVLWDDVGTGFDIDQVAATVDDVDLDDELLQAEHERRETVAAELLPVAEAALGAARDRVD